MMASPRDATHPQRISASLPGTVARRTWRRRVGRAVAALLLTLHAAATGVLPVLDGSLESGARAVAHWEDASYSACPAVHDSAACRVCQLLSSGQETASCGVAVTPAGATRVPITVDASLALRSPALGSNGPRAPPVA